MDRRTMLGKSAAFGTAGAFALQAGAQDVPVGPPDPAVMNRLGSRWVRAHDPSTPVKCGDSYWVFATGRGLPSLRSHDLKTWEPGRRTFDKAPEWVAAEVPGNRGGLDFWAPDVVRTADRYRLYYSVSTFGKNTSAIALASNLSLDPAAPGYRWKDEGVVIRSGPADDFNAIDPATFVDAEGRSWLSFGSFWGGIQLVELEPATGRRLAPNSPVRPIARSREIEAPHLFRHADWYYLVVNWGRCCRGVNSTYSMRIGRSRDVTGPYFDKTGKPLAEGGGSLLLGTEGPFIGPGHAGVFEADGTAQMSMHFYDGTRGGVGTLAIRPLRFDAGGWPMVG